MHQYMLAIFAVLFLVAAPVSEAQEQADIGPPAQIIEDIAGTLEKYYVLPQDVPAIKAALMERHAAGRYEDAATPQALASLLGRDLVDITADEHFSVSFVPDDGAEPTYDLDDIEIARRSNFGFKSVKVLPGNIGYIRLDHFADPRIGFDTAAGAMQFVENSEALIIDLRYNNGGYTDMIQLLASYFFSGDDDVLLYDFAVNDNGLLIERGHWVLSGLKGKRTPDRPLYILTSSLTFSAAEWFAFSMSELGRATIIGQVTSGAANPVTLHRANQNFLVQVPIGKARGPVSKSDFQERGVTPDIEVASHGALNMAHRMAIQTTSDDDERSQWLLPMISDPNGNLAEKQKDARDVVGNYGRMAITLEDNVLIYRWRDRFTMALTPLGGGLLAAEEAYDWRFRILREGDKVIGVAREFEDWSSVTYERVE